MVTLNLSNNQIGPEGIHNLADALQYNKVLLYSKNLNIFLF